MTIFKTLMHSEFWILGHKKLIQTLVHKHHLFYAPIVTGKYIRGRYKINGANFLSYDEFSSHRPILLPSNSKHILNFANIVINIIIKILNFIPKKIMLVFLACFE